MFGAISDGTRVTVRLNSNIYPKLNVETAIASHNKKGQQKHVLKLLAT